jgi:hypothetical protein
LKLIHIRHRSNISVCCNFGDKSPGDIGDLEILAQISIWQYLKNCAAENF